jgi:hypothetical protein
MCKKQPQLCDSKPGMCHNIHTTLPVCTTSVGWSCCCLHHLLALTCWHRCFCTHIADPRPAERPRKASPQPARRSQHQLHSQHQPLFCACAHRRRHLHTDRDPTHIRLHLDRRGACCHLDANCGRKHWCGARDSYTAGRSSRGGSPRCGCSSGCGRRVQWLECPDQPSDRTCRDRRQARATHVGPGTGPRFAGRSDAHLARCQGQWLRGV